MNGTSDGVMKISDTAAENIRQTALRKRHAPAR
jgi:hypothetical protein